MLEHCTAAQVTAEYLGMVERASLLVPELRETPTDLLLRPGDTVLPPELRGVAREELAVRLLLLRLGREQGGPPFRAMFGRQAVVGRREGEVRQTRRKLQSSVLHCRHCAETFTSKISFRIHQRRFHFW